MTNLDDSERGCRRQDQQTGQTRLKQNDRHNEYVGRIQWNAHDWKSYSPT